MAPPRIRKVFSGFAPDLQIDLKGPCNISTGDRDEEKMSPQDNTKSNCGFSKQGKKQSICNACKVIQFGKAQNNVKRLKRMKRCISELIQLLQ